MSLFISASFSTIYLLNPSISSFLYHICTKCLFYISFFLCYILTESLSVVSTPISVIQVLNISYKSYKSYRYLLYQLLSPLCTYSIPHCYISSFMSYVCTKCLFYIGFFLHYKLTDSLSVSSASFSIIYVLIVCFISASFSTINLLISTLFHQLLSLSYMY